MSVLQPATDDAPRDRPPGFDDGLENLALCGRIHMALAKQSTDIDNMGLCKNTEELVACVAAFTQQAVNIMTMCNDEIARAEAHLGHTDLVDAAVNPPERALQLRTDTLRFLRARQERTMINITSSLECILARERANRSCRPE